ncbi:hypothetical protein HDU97_000076 [Phlyctochytrium planicorne]|nr:hypothetical protein HDU97_000076 [Phlyctochytrium planicorne]
MVELVVTDKLRDAVEALFSLSKRNASLLNDLKPYRSHPIETDGEDSKAKIPHQLVGQLLRALQAINSSGYGNSEKLVQLLKQCQDNLDRQEYDRMTADLIPKKHDDDVADMKKALGVFGSIANVVLSMAAVFAAIMYFGQSLAPDVGVVSSFMVILK